MNGARQKNGFSLVEVICAILILGVGLAGLTHGITSALLANKESEIQTTAAGLAAGQIELLRAEGFLLEGETSGEYVEGLATYAWKQSVRESDIQGLYEIQVTIHHAKTDQEIFELSTMLFDPPVLEETAPTSRDRERERERRRN